MKLVLVTGVTGRLGGAYLKEYKKERNVKVVGCSRKRVEKAFPNIQYLEFDLLKEFEIKSNLTKVDFKGVNEIVLVHPIGMFKFEKNNHPKKDKNHDGIDDDIYASNVLTFRNIFFSLKKIIKNYEKIRLTVCAFGSISDKYNIPFWHSYTQSKKILRKFIKKQSKASKIRGVFINVSTTDTGNERNLRPHAQKTYWLTPKEIVNHSKSFIDKAKAQYTEVNIYKNNPHFDITWYTNHDNVLERWQKQMGLISSKNL